MSFKLTYSTMFDPPAELHTRFEAAMAKLNAQPAASHALYIDGKEVTAAEAPLIGPIDRTRLLGRFAVATSDHVHQAVTAAHRAFDGWRKTPMAARNVILHRVADLIEERVYDISAALTLEVGKNRMEALGEVQETADFFRIYADDFERNHGFDHRLPDDPLTGYVSRNRSILKPHGVWGVIVPFNFPIALAGGPVAAALVTGNTVVLKAAPTTPWSCRLLADCLRDAGVPPGVFNYLGGGSDEVGKALVHHPQTAGITFTGSHEVGMEIARAMLAGPYPKPCIAEMGGKNACLVTADADLDRAALGIVRSAFGLTGQKCSALSRVYVDGSIADALAEKLVAATQAIKIGDPAKRENWLGTVGTEAGYNAYPKYIDQLSKNGGKILTGGKRLTDGDYGKGLFVEPTIAEAPADHPLYSREMFLPILMICRVTSNEEAIRLINASPLGLTAGVYGNNDEVNWFLDHIEAGVTYANRPQGATTGAWPGYQPFGGWKGSGSTGKAIASFYYLPLYLREQSQTVVD